MLRIHQPMARAGEVDLLIEDGLKEDLAGQKSLLRVISDISEKIDLGEQRSID